MTSIDQMVSSQQGIIPQVTGDITNAKFWAGTVFLDRYSDYCYTHLMMGASDEETPPLQGILQALGSSTSGKGLHLQGRQWKVLRATVKGGSPNLRTTGKLLWGEISSPKHNC